MVNFYDLTEEKRKKFEPIFLVMDEMTDNLNSLVFLYDYKGTEKLLQIDGNICRSWYFLEDNNISYNEFEVDNNCDISFVALDDAILIEEKDEAFFYNRHTNCLEDFMFIPKEEQDAQGYNGLAVYSQYNEEKDIRAALIYQHMQKPNNTVYKMHLKNPIQILIDKNVNSKIKSEAYARYDFDARKNYNAFRIATIKDYGLLNTFNKDLISLQRDTKISRYYKILNMHSDSEEVRVSYPFGSQYKLEEIFEYLNKLGFNTEVPDYLIDMNNQKNEEYMESLQLATILKMYNNEYKKEKGYSLILSK